MRPLLRSSVSLGLAAAFLVLFLNALVAHQAITVLVENNRLVSHTHRVQEALETLASTLTEAESEQRGYVITRDPAYLKSYTDALAALGPRLDQVNVLTADNPWRQE